MATTDKKPSFAVALGTFVIIAAIIAYGLLGLGLDATCLSRWRRPSLRS